MVLTESGWPFAIPTRFLAQGRGMFWCCEVVSAFLISPGCCMQWCWCVQLVQPCCWVIDSAKHLSCLACPAAVSKQKKRKLLSCLYPATLLFQQILRLMKFPGKGAKKFPERSPSGYEASGFLCLWSLQDFENVCWLPGWTSGFWDVLGLAFCI